jgi:hypothetical protein
VADNDKKSGGSLGKVIAWVGGIVGTITTAVAVPYINNAINKPQATQAAPPGTPGTPPTTGPARPALVHLVHPKLSTNFYSYTWNEKRGAEHGYVRSDTVNSNFFTFLPTPPHILASGWTGGLVTRKEFDNYTLLVEYRWVGKKEPAVAGLPRRAAILVNATGTDYSYQDPWPQSIKVLLHEGFTGAIQLLGEPGKIEASARFKETKTKETTKDGKEVTRVRREYDPTAAPAPVVTGKPEGWNNVLYRAGSPEKAPEKGPAKGDETAFWHPPGDPTKPQLNAWNKIRITCNSDTGLIQVRVNNTDVNEITIHSPSQRKGRIVFTGEMAAFDILHADVEAHPR